MKHTDEMTKGQKRELLVEIVKAIKENMTSKPFGDKFVAENVKIEAYEYERGVGVRSTIQIGTKELEITGVGIPLEFAFKNGEMKIEKEGIAGGVREFLGQTDSYQEEITRWCSEVKPKENLKTIYQFGEFDRELLREYPELTIEEDDRLDGLYLKWDKETKEVVFTAEFWKGDKRVEFEIGREHPDKKPKFFRELEKGYHADQLSDYDEWWSKAHELANEKGYFFEGEGEDAEEDEYSDVEYDRRAIEERYGLEDGELDGKSIREAEEICGEEEGGFDMYIIDDIDDPDAEDEDASWDEKANRYDGERPWDYGRHFDDDDDDADSSDSED